MKIKDIDSIHAKGSIHAERNRWYADNVKGKWITFIHPDYPDKLACGVAEGGRFIGLRERGNIPEYEMDVKGRTGRTARIRMVENHAGVCDSKEEAIKKVKGEWYV